MIGPHTAPPTFRPPELATPEKPEPLDRALEELVTNDQWIDDFVKRLNYTIDDIVRRK